jgi:hypothetical protein
MPPPLCPPMPVNRLSIRVFAGVCSFGVRFAHWQDGRNLPHATRPHRKTQQNKGWHKGGVPLRHPPPRRHPFGLCAHWSLQDVPDLRGQDQETPMPHLGSMPDPKDKPRTLLVGWISRLDLALELGLSVDTLRRWEAMRTGPALRSRRAQGLLPPRRRRGMAGGAGAGRPASPSCRRAPVMHPPLAVPPGPPTVSPRPAPSSPTSRITAIS